MLSAYDDSPLRMVDGCESISRDFERAAETRSPPRKLEGASKKYAPLEKAGMLTKHILHVDGRGSGSAPPWATRPGVGPKPESQPDARRAPHHSQRRAHPGGDTFVRPEVTSSIATIFNKQKTSQSYSET
jgi:hypothetical protein